MSAVRSRAQLAVGSAPWIHDENEQATQFCAQEVEDFTFSARNEVEWLNEHMADIFSKNQVNVTEIFKTPGKLRGKTPRTARKRNPLEVREPLTDIFSANAPQNSTLKHNTGSSKTAPTFSVAEDSVVPILVKKTTKTNTDSGYGGLPEDDMDIDDMPVVPQSSTETNDTVEIFPKSPLPDHTGSTNHSEGHSTADRSFQSAKEEITEKSSHEKPQTESQPVAEAEIINDPVMDGVVEFEAPPTGEESEDTMDVENVDKDLEQDLIVDESRSTSQGSSPARPLVRKSSLTFAALPAREPLTTKKSIGARVSGLNHLDQSKGNLNRGISLGRFTGGKSLGGSKQPEPAQEPKDIDEMEVELELELEKPQLAREESDTDAKMTKLHNKLSAQKLHDRINMLGGKGKNQPARPTNPIPTAATAINPSYPELPIQDVQTNHLQDIAVLASKAEASQVTDQDNDDWIQPPQPHTTQSVQAQPSNSSSADAVEDIRGKQTTSGQDIGRIHDNEQAVSRPAPSRQPSAYEAYADDRVSPSAAAISCPDASIMTSTHAPKQPVKVLDPLMIPAGSPLSKRYVDGPLSASKSKLQSMMKTARGLFSSSAGLSAQAKMETLSPSSARKHGKHQDSSIEAAMLDKSLQKAPLRSPMANPAGRKTRSSTEKEGKRKESAANERERIEAESAQLHEQSSGKLADEQHPQPKGTVAELVQQHSKPTRQSPRRTQNNEGLKNPSVVAEDEPPSQSMGPPATHVQDQQSQLQRPKEVRRPIKPAKEAASKPKPQPVAIRVGTLSGTLSQGIRMNNSALSSTLQDSLPPTQPKRPAVTKKASNASIHSAASNSTLKGSASSITTKPKALIAAERKKEQDEKEAQRKLDQKRELERKRAAQQEELRKQEQLQRQEAERQRERERTAAAEDPKVLARKQAIEKRRLEMKKDQQKASQRPVDDHVPAAQPAHAASTLRQELGGPRPPSRLHNLPEQDRPTISQPLHNAAKPPKRIFDPEADDEHYRPVRLQGGPAYQQNEGKRRKTEDEAPEEVRVRPTMAPPIRQSGIRQGGLKPSIFGSSYTAAPPPASHHQNSNSLLKSTTANQAYQQHSHQNQLARPGHHPDIGKYQNGKIPFGENPNPPHVSHPHKTPLQSRFAPQAAKSSPQYVNGENIHLDDIPTESEDESDDDYNSKPKAANVPDWARTPELRQLLMTQDENVDADAVFGPVQSPHIEEMFKERHHRFRSRTSSANWAGADRLTEEEIRRDVEARQRLRRDGGWTFGL